MSDNHIWTPGGRGKSAIPRTGIPDHELPTVESTLTLACGHRTTTTDQDALRGQEAINDGRAIAHAFCPHELCRVSQRILVVEAKQVHDGGPAPEPEEVDYERELYEWEKEHGYRNPETGEYYPEHKGKQKRKGWGPGV